MAERNGDREVMDRMVRDAVNSGLDPRKAREKVKQAMIQMDDRLERSGKR